MLLPAKRCTHFSISFWPPRNLRTSSTQSSCRTVLEISRFPNRKIQELPGRDSICDSVILVKIDFEFTLNLSQCTLAMHLGHLQQLECGSVVAEFEAIALISQPTADNGIERRSLLPVSMLAGLRSTNRDCETTRCVGGCVLEGLNLSFGDR